MSEGHKTSRYVRIVVRIAIGVAVAAVIAFLIFFFVYFHVESIEVIGNSYFTDEEIQEMVLKNPLTTNSVLAPYFYSKSEAEKSFAIDEISVSRKDPNSLLISVDESEMVGCFQFLDCFMYFDSQGIVLGSGTVRQQHLPFFRDMNVESVQIGQKVTFSDESMLTVAVSLAQLLAHSNYLPAYVTIDNNDNIILVYGDIQAQLGSEMYLSDKMTRLDAILPQILGRTGILHLENVTDINKTITFEEEGVVTENAGNGDDEEGNKKNNADAENDSSSDNDSQNSSDSDSQSNSDSDYISDSNYNSDYSSDYSSDSDSNYYSDSDSSSDSGYDSSYDSE